MASASGPKMRAATPGLSSTLSMVIFASSLRVGDAADDLLSTISSSSQTMVPISSRLPARTGAIASGSTKLDSTRVLTRCTMASSTERVCSTFEPEDAISSISSYETLGSRRALGTMRGSVV